jgi:HemY protein
MRRIFLFALIALLAGVGVVAVIETDPGYVLVSYGNYTLETSLWVGLLLFLLLTLLIYGAVRLVHALVAGQHSVANWLGTRQVRRSSRLTTRGLISFIEGHWAKARKQLLQGAKNNEAPLINYLMAARSSYRLGEPDKMREYLGAAEASESEAGTAVALTQAELRLQARQYEQALATLVRVRKDAGRHPYVLELLCRAYRGLKDWDNVVALVPELRKHEVLPESELEQLEREAYLQLLERSVTRGEGAPGERLQAVWQKVPSSVRQSPEVVRVYTRLLVEHGEHATAENTISRALKHHWDSELVRLSGLLESTNPQGQLRQAESWLPAHPEDPELLLCLGRLSARDKLWGKARDYFESSYRLERRPETCAELGRLLVALGETKVAAAYFREGLLLRESRLPDLPMPEQVVPHSRRLAN